MGWGKGKGEMMGMQPSISGATSQLSDTITSDDLPLLLLKDSDEASKARVEAGLPAALPSAQPPALADAVSHTQESNRWASPNQPESNRWASPNPPA